MNKKVCIKLDSIADKWDVLFTESGINPTAITLDNRGDAEIMKEAFVMVGYKEVIEI